MKIRSITCFYHPGTPHAPQVLNRLAELAEIASRRYQDAGYEVQSTRLATVPFPQVLEALTPDAAVEYAVAMQARAQQNGFTYVSLGPALARVPESYPLVNPMLAATQMVFLSGEIANPEEGVVLSGVKACGKIIADVSKINASGLGNLRFAAVANVGPYGPYFPASYAANAQPAFALAIEAADLVTGIFQSARTLAAARKRLVQTLEAQGRALAAIGEDLAHSFEIEFKGIDFSMSPYPQDGGSLGAALERLGVPQVGLAGSLAAAAFLADASERANWPRVGFNATMLPVLEDTVLAERAAYGALTVKDLLLYATVCGAGLDIVPVPGDASPDQLAAVLLDVAALSARLGKPLLGRLLPIPGKAAGEDVHFHFDYIASGRVMALPALPLRGPFNSNESFTLNPRH